MKLMAHLRNGFLRLNIFLFPVFFVFFFFSKNRVLRFFHKFKHPFAEKPWKTKRNAKVRFDHFSKTPSLQSYTFLFFQSKNAKKNY